MYKKFKEWCKEHLTEIKYVCAGIVLFVAGYGCGRYYSQVDHGKPLNTLSQQYRTDVQAAMPTKEGCLIKGNISGDGKRVYHVPTGKLYKKTVAEKCFSSEAEAIADGFIKSNR